MEVYLQHVNSRQTWSNFHTRPADKSDQSNSTKHRLSDTVSLFPVYSFYNKSQFLHKNDKPFYHSFLTEQDAVNLYILFKYFKIFIDHYTTKPLLGLKPAVMQLIAQQKLPCSKAEATHSHENYTTK